MTNFSRLGWGFAFTLGYALLGTSAFAQSTVTPEPMPNGMNFPTPGYVIQQWVDAADHTKIRAHGWNIWNAMTQPSSQTWQGKTLPIWDTWYSDVELFNTPAEVLATGERQLHPFHEIRQIGHMSPADQQTSNQQLISFNKFNPPAAEYILTEQVNPGVGGTAHPINVKSGLEAFNDAWPQGTPAGVRALADFSQRSMETKPVFQLVYHQRPTALPYWTGPTNSGNPTNPTPDTWNSCVIIDPAIPATSGMQPATFIEIISAFYPTSVSRCLNSGLGGIYYAPMGMIYSVVLDESGAAAFNQQNSPQPPASAGDYAVLVAMHVNTKELDSWTWQTFYWQGSSQFQATFPGSLDAQPSGLGAPWSSYAMCTAYDQVIGGQPTVCFNPYLETDSSIPDGIQSNCVSCHGMARNPPEPNVFDPNPRFFPYPANYTNLPIQFDDPSIFSDTTKTDFSWAVGLTSGAR